MSEQFRSPSWHRVAGLKPRMRGHVQVHRHRYRGAAWYVIQDNISGRFHRFTPAVYLFIGLMNGRRTINDIWSIAVEQLGDDAPTQGDIIDLLSRLHAADLLQTDISPDAAELFDRSTRHSRAKLRGRLGNPLAVRIPLLDPDRFLDRTLGLVEPVFTRLGALIWISVVFSALSIVAVNWAELTDNIANRIFAIENLVLMVLIFPVIKILHELGHAYATKSAGGEIHELGIMFLVFAPVPYVDASASAAIRSKWWRSFVGAAGMIVELFLAALAAFVWIAVEPGIVRSLAYQAMLIAGVSTIIFNANPLLRFDGYYILCDLIEIPNLGQRSNQFWGWLVERYLFGVKAKSPHGTTGERIWFCVYAPLAFIYRMVVLFGISMFVASEFFVVGVVIAIWGIFASIGLPALKYIRQVLTSPRIRAKRLRTTSVLVGAAVAILSLLFLVPMPLHTHSEGIVWLPEESFVRAGSDGFVKMFAARPGDHVSYQQVLIENEEPTIDASVRVLQSQVAGLAARLLSEQFNDRVQADITRQELQIKQANLAHASERSELLRVRSNSNGTFLVPNSQDMPGRFFKRGDIMGYVVSSSARVVRVVVTQSDIELVRQRLVSTDIKLANDLGHSYRTNVFRQVPAASDRLPSKAFSDIGGGQFTSDPRDPNQTRTLQRNFQFDLEFPDEIPIANYGTRVYIRFNHGFEPLGLQWYRRIRQLLLARFDA